MTEIEKKALELVHSVSDYEAADLDDAQFCDVVQALCRAIEQHEAFKREVSDAVEKILNCTNVNKRYGACLALNRFILPKPDPLVEAMHDCGVDRFESWADQLRAALAARGLKIVEVGHG